MELSSGPAAQSRHHLQTVQTTADGTPFSGNMNTALCDFHLLTYLPLQLVLLQQCIVYLMFMATAGNIVLSAVVKI